MTLRTRWWLAGAVLAASLPLMVALWVAVALWTGPSLVGGMALVLAADAWLLLRLAGVGRGRRRALAASTFVLVGSAASVWFVVAAEIGRTFGLTPWASGERLGVGLFSAVARELGGPWDVATILAGVAMAVAINLPHGRRFRPADAAPPSGETRR